MLINQYRSGPVFSVVTVCRNAEMVLGSTIDSVLGQSFEDYEYIVWVATSEDKTKEVAEQYASRRMKILSKDDNGVFDAMNRSLSYCTGQFVVFLNAGDRFYSSDVLRHVFGNLGGTPDVVYGDHVVVYPDGRKRYVRAGRVEVLHSHMPFCHQSCFVRREIALDTWFDSANMAADYGMFLRLFVSGAYFRRVPYFLTLYSAGGISDRRRVESIQSRLLFQHKLGVGWVYTARNYLEILFQVVLSFYKRHIVRRRDL